MSVRGAAALVAGLAGPASALDGHPLGGTWVGRWSNGAHQEVRIDGRGDDGRVEGTFCGVRAGDGSAFWFDLDDVETNESDGTIEVRRGQDTLRFTRQSDETARYEIERLGKTHRLTLTPPSAQLRARCLERVLRAHEARERSAAAGPGLDGAWSYTGKGAHHIALEVRAVRQGHYAGTVCWQRKDRSKVFYDFAPRAKIEARATAGGLIIERTPFKATLRQRAERDAEGTLRWSQQIQRRPWEGGVALTPGASEAHCLARLGPKR